MLADNYAVHQVFGNLISNALRYAQSGKKIVVGAHERENGIEFFVRDLDLASLLNTCLASSSASTALIKPVPESGGTGLGLAIVKHIVSIMAAPSGWKALLGTEPPSSSYYQKSSSAIVGYHAALYPSPSLGSHRIPGYPSLA